MSNTKKNEITLKCFKNGIVGIYTVEQAHKQLWQSNYSWIFPLDLYQWNINGFRGKSQVYNVIKKSAVQFGFMAHTQCQPLTIDDCEMHIYKGAELEYNVFVAWASKFNRLFKNTDPSKSLPKTLWPLCYIVVPLAGSTLITRPAYMRHPDRSFFVIEGANPSSGYRNTDIQWSLFLTEPDTM